MQMPASENNFEAVSGTQLDASSTSTSRSLGMTSGRKKQRKATREGNKNDRKGPISENNIEKKSLNTRVPKPKGTKDFRYLEVVKLVRKHIPITINGSAVTKILESQMMMAKSEGQAVSTTIKPLSRKAKETIVADHIQNVIRRDPQQPLYLSFIMKPADPDFPFELDLLNFSLTIPAEYPRSLKAIPSIVVLNTEIPRGFSVNIERGFRTIANLTKHTQLLPKDGEEIKLVDGKGLLSQVQTLNKYLEFFLQQEKRQTMKFVTFKNSPKASALPTPSQSPVPKPKPQQKLDLAAEAFEDKKVTVTEATRLKREFYIGEMTQKLGQNVKLFNRSKGEARYKVQIPIVNPANVPHLWTYGNRTVDIFVTVPHSYPETPVRAIVASNFSSNLLVAKKKALTSEGHDLIKLMGEARAAEKHFNSNVKEFSLGDTPGLVQHLNWISNQLNLLICSENHYKEYVAQMRTLKIAT